MPPRATSSTASDHRADRSQCGVQAAGRHYGVGVDMGPPGRRLCGEDRIDEGGRMHPFQRDALGQRSLAPVQGKIRVRQGVQNRRQPRGAFRMLAPLRMRARVVRRHL